MFLLCTERVADAGFDRIDAGIGQCLVDLARPVDDIAVVAGVTT